METADMGFCQVDITPSSPMQTIGFGRVDEFSRGVLDNLSAQAAVWQLSAEKCCLVTIDHIGFAKQHANRLRDEIGLLLSIPREKVMLCFSHTHSAPNDSIELAYSDMVDDRVKAAVRDAAAAMSSVKIAWATAYGEIGVNRRPEQEVLDRRIGILKVTDAVSGALRLLLLRLTAHANVLKADNFLISSDYFGSVRDLLTKKYGCPIQLTQGASGDIAPKYYTTDRVGTAANPLPAYYGKIESAAALSDMAGEVTRQVEPVLTGLLPSAVKELKMYSVFQQLHADVPTMQRAMAIAAEAKSEAGIDGTAWLSEVQQLIENKVEKQTDQVELQYFSINEGCFCGVANEIMCDFALRAREQSKRKQFYLGGYTNGCTGYFPTEEEFDKGGYEVYWSMLIYYQYHGRVSPLNRDAATQLIEAAVKNAPR